MGLDLQRARVGRIAMAQPVIRRKRQGWAVMALQYNGEWWYVGKDDRRPIDNEPRTVYRDLVQKAVDAQVFQRKRDAVRFAFMVAYTNPQRTGQIKVVDV